MIVEQIVMRRPRLAVAVARNRCVINWPELGREEAKGNDAL